MTPHAAAATPIPAIREFRLGFFAALIFNIVAVTSYRACVSQSTIKFPMAEGKTFGSRLRWVREQYDLTLEQFGEQIGVGRSYVSKLENGKSKNASEWFIESACSQLHLQREWLLTGKGEPFTHDALNQAAKQGKTLPSLPSHADAPGTSDYANALHLAGIFLVIQPTVGHLAETMSQFLSNQSYPPQLRLFMGIFLAAEIDAQIKSKAPMDKPITTPASEEGRMAIKMLEVSKEQEKKKRAQVIVS